jgi:hypothetical protein
MVMWYEKDDIWRGILATDTDTPTGIAKIIQRQIEFDVNLQRPATHIQMGMGLINDMS